MIDTPSALVFMVYRSRGPRIVLLEELPDLLCQDMLSAYVFDPMEDQPWLRLTNPSLPSTT